jgi:hypothetical protein
MKHLKTQKQLNEGKENLNISDVRESKIIRGDNFHLDLLDFEKLSREVGFYNCMSNLKDTEDELDMENVSKYEELREKQLIMFLQLLEFYSY